MHSTEVCTAMNVLCTALGLDPSAGVTFPVQQYGMSCLSSFSGKCRLSSSCLPHHFSNTVGVACTVLAVGVPSSSSRSRCTIRGPSGRCACLFSAVCPVYTESFACSVQALGVPVQSKQCCLSSLNIWCCLYSPAIAVACHVQTVVLPVQSKQ